MSHELILEGTLGVDARRAARKIRDHLLANPATWLAELGRVAVSSNATKLAVDLRGTSIVVEWNGEPIAPVVIDHFGRHLLGEDEEIEPKKRRARPDRRPELLTLAVFAALGDIAKSVEIRVAVDGNGAKARCLTREELEGDLTGGGARVTSMARGAAFELLSDATGGLVLELGARLGALGHWLGIAAPPDAVRELGSRMGCGLEVFVEGERLVPVAPEPVLSFELPTAADRVIRLDLMETPQAEPRVVFYELGFEIARAVLFEPTLELPIRVVVSGTKIPTNASRSQVDETVVEIVEREVIAWLPQACEGLRSAIVAALARGDARARRSLEQAAGYLAAVALRANQAEPLYKAFAPTLDWPLLADAAGRPLGVRDAQRRADGYEIHCRVQDEPLSAEYAPLVSDVLWRRGHSAESAFRLLDYDAIAEEVEAGLRRRRQLAQNRVPFGPPPCATARSHHRGVEKDGCEWQLTLDTASNGPCKLRVFVGDDLIETREVDHSSPLYRFDAAIRWPGVVVADRAHDKIRIGHGSSAMFGVLARVVKASLMQSLEAGAVRSPGPARTLALRMLAPTLKPSPELSSLPLWQRAGAGFLSTAELRASVEARGHLFVIARALGPGESAPHEPLVIVADAELPQLRTALDDATLLDYAAHASAPIATVETVQQYFSRAELASYAYKWGEHWVAVTPAARGRHLAFHRGILVTDVALGGETGMVVVTDGETLLHAPAADHAAMLKQAWLSLVGWLAGDRALMSASLEAPGVRAALLAKLSADIANGALPVVPFVDWPVFRLFTAALGERDASVTDIVAHFGELGELPTLPPGMPYDASIDRVVATERERAALERLAMLPCVDPAKPATPEIPIERSPDVGAGASDDLLAALHDIAPIPLRPGGAAPAKPSPEPLARSKPPRPLPNPPAATAKAARTPTAGDPGEAPPASPADPDDVLGPIRYLMTESKERQAAEAQKRADAKAKAEAESKALQTAAALAAINAPPATEPPPKPPPQESAWDKIVGLFKKPLQEVPSRHPLSTLLRRVTENLYVADLQVRFSEPGEAAVRFEKRTTTLVVNPNNPTVRVLIANGDVVPLVAAAFSEINRELKVVSDEEERRALGRLLLDMPGA